MSKVNINSATIVKIGGRKYSTATGAARAWAFMVWNDMITRKKQTLSHSAFEKWLYSSAKTVQSGPLELVEHWSHEERAYRRSLKIFKQILP
jgi:hypothetical protein